MTGEVRRPAEPTRAQWRILQAIVEAGRLRRMGRRFVADEAAPRSFGFTPVMHLVSRGLVRPVDADLKTVEPTALARRVVVDRSETEGPLA